MTTPKRRHGCLTAWLAVLIVLDSLSALLYLLGDSLAGKLLPDLPAWFEPVTIAASVLNVAFAVALFFWRRWGFWGYLATSVGMLAVNLYAGLGIGQSLIGLVGVAVLYAVLHIGQDDRGWPQLE